MTLSRFVLLVQKPKKEMSGFRVRQKKALLARQTGKAGRLQADFKEEGFIWGRW